MIGEGEEYRAIREAARAQVSDWIPWGLENSQNYWSFVIGGVVHEEDGSNTVSILTGFNDWEKPNGITHKKSFDTHSLRAAAISLLVYCEAHDPLPERGLAIYPELEE